ncbi:M28 family peptidase [Novilysobacter selenitireducens]|uniref:M20/M25/M40 family metallo-hydrolase n=1 Tax=Novilysobacter selenitireducens TaxID=2872639 RepID=A0ABS7T272_9GAMM|nr:M28 family peptidase [Lysobacter selenitireducens]MBZ4037963.1 M20/M25/M40 family metallo-hydrolase [Lysobacter selenitireducens]
MRTLIPSTAAALAAILLAACTAERVDAPASASAARIRADVQVLADDRMQGRMTGTPGFDHAARYVAVRMQRIGLEPAGDSGWLQRVPLQQSVAIVERAVVAVRNDGRSTRLQPGRDVLPAPGFEDAVALTDLPMVFAGHGVHAPELGVDDFTGLDLRGKAVLLLGGTPARLEPDLRAYYGATGTKLEALAARGAVAAVFLRTPADEAALPWSRLAEVLARPAMRLAEAPQTTVRAVLHVHADAVDTLLAGSGRTLAQLAAQADAGALPTFALPNRLDLATASRLQPVESANVVGRLPGSDARRAGQVAITAHLDHLGVGVGGDDRIFNGAVDNALGVAVMLEAARRMAAAPAPARDTLFVALTGEEQGLLGAQAFAQAATDGALVANLNLDMPLLLAPTRDAGVAGVERSELGGHVREAADAMDVALTPDPMAAQGTFVRSDQFAFVRRGVPALYLMGGTDPVRRNDDPAAAAAAFMRERYHRPEDDADSPIAWNDAARLAGLVARTAASVADAPRPPAWRAGDFFGGRFAPSRPLESPPLP